jgi:uncharacterized membrane protein YciS (DUF1049 family)
MIYTLFIIAFSLGFMIIMGIFYKKTRIDVKHREDSWIIKLLWTAAAI